MDCKEIQPVYSKGDQPWDFFGRTDAKAETPVLWPPHAKSLLIGKDSDAGRDWGQEEKGTTEDEMAGWHHWLDGFGFGWTPGVGDGQGGLVCCNSWGRKESDTTERLNWTDSPGAGWGSMDGKLLRGSIKARWNLTQLKWRDSSQKWTRVFRHWGWGMRNLIKDNQISKVGDICYTDAAGFLRLEKWAKGRA